MNTNYLFVKVFKLEKNYAYRIIYYENYKEIKKDYYDISLDIAKIKDAIINLKEQINDKKLKIIINIISYDVISLNIINDNLSNTKKINDLNLVEFAERKFNEFNDDYIIDTIYHKKNHIHQASLYLIPRKIKEEYALLKELKIKNTYLKLDTFSTNDYLQERKHYFFNKRVLLIINDYDLIRIYSLYNLTINGFILQNKEEAIENTLPLVIVNNSFDEIIFDGSKDEYETLLEKYPNEFIVYLKNINELKNIDYDKLIY